MSFMKIIIIIVLSQYIFGCVEKTTYSGKIITNEDLDLKLFNKEELISKFGHPSYIDTISKKYFYFTEKKKETNFYNKNVEYSYLFVFDKNHKYRKIETSNNIIKRGLLETIFGGIGNNPIPNSP